jgi:hypothetical protein
MKQIAIIFLATLFFTNAKAQIADSIVAQGKVTVHQDYRLDILAKKEKDFNKATSSLNAKAAMGYRLLVLSSNDRNYAMKIRTVLLQRFPEEKVHMTFQAPFIKLKFGDFVDRGDADRYKKMILSSRIVTNNIYIVSEAVEVKNYKNNETEDN